MSLSVYLMEMQPVSVSSSNMTHNLGYMAREAGIYGVLWRPEENGIKKARDLVQPLRVGLERLKADPERFKKFEPDNGWGTYGDLVTVVEGLILSCCEHPDADVEISR